MAFADVNTSPFFYRIIPDREWVDSQIPEIVKKSFNDIGDDINDCDEMMDIETICQAYINVVTGACMSIGEAFFI